jgi:hypothetical protein
MLDASLRDPQHARLIKIETIQARFGSSIKAPAQHPRRDMKKHKETVLFVLLGVPSWLLDQRFRGYVPPARQLDQRRRICVGDQLDGQNVPSLVMTTARTLAGTRPYARMMCASSEGR